MNVRFIFIVLISIITAFSFIGCEGDIGPQGVTGTTGPAGPTGPGGANGDDGQNGAENCLECHGSNQLITAKMFQWENSGHALNGHYERNTASCAGCHTSQGFIDRIADGGMTATMDVEDPLPQNCYTCHSIHQTYTSEDWALTAPDPVTIWISGATVDIGKGNQCLNCHQPRIPGDGVPDVNDTGDYTITSSRYGPHHGAQGTMFAGVGQSGAYEIGEGYENSLHTSLVADACITCHMAPVIDGRGAGGHTFRVETEGGDLNTNGCVQCHDDSDALETLFAGTQGGIDVLLDSLAVKLRDVGILNATANRSVPGTYSAVEVGSYYNYIFIVEDQSKGVHNAKYTRKLIENSLDALQ